MKSPGLGADFEILLFFDVVDRGAREKREEAELECELEMMPSKLFC